ncbi:MAG: hypothetical protein KC646_06775 [Candidatus Cloacimonetes bacterium]|nr:hypothetical protein [Candidatus Cloacimonadota bacterium]
MQKLLFSLLFIFTLITSTTADDAFQANLHILVLQSSLMEYHPSADNSKEYDSILNKIYQEILPTFDFEPDEKLMGFYVFISKYEISKMKYFVPLLEKIKANLKMRLVNGEEGVVQDHHDVLSEVLEDIDSKVIEFEESVKEDSSPGVVSNEKTESETDTDDTSEPEEQKDETTEDPDKNEADQDLSELKQEIITLKKNINDSVSKIGSLQDQIKSLKNNDEAIEEIQEKLEQVAKDKEKVVEELKTLSEKMLEYEKSKGEMLDELAALKEKLDGTPEMPKPPTPPQEPIPSPAPKPAPKPEKPVYKRPPFFCDYRIYGSKAMAVRAIKASLSASGVNKVGFDPRVHNLLKNGWKLLLTKHNYRALPTELIGAMGNAGIKVRLGSDAKALELSKSNYLTDVKKYLKNGGQKCLVNLAKKAGLDYKTKKLSCK